MDSEKIRRNIIIRLSRSRCKLCFKPFSKDVHWHSYSNDDDYIFFSEKQYFEIARPKGMPLREKLHFVGQDDDITRGFILREGFAPNKVRSYSDVEYITVYCSGCYAMTVMEFSAISY